MSNLSTIEPAGGAVVLRGITVDVNSDVGQAFVVDVCRHVEDLLDASALRKKYGLNDDEAYASLGANEPLQRAIAAAKIRRIHNGDAARERAQHLFLTTPDVLGGIVNDVGASPRHRIEAARELRQVAAVGPSDTQKSERERFTININFGTAKVVKNVEWKPKPETLTIEPSDGEQEESEYGF
jgi:hypothetical protein